VIYDEASQRDALDRQLDAFRVAAAKLFALRPQIRSVIELLTATWWKQLERLTLHYAERDEFAAWHARRDELGVPWLAVQQAYSDPTNALGWELAFGPSGACEATLRGFTPHATFAELGKMAKQVPFVPTLVASEYYAPATGDLETERSSNP